eukprot:CAMPEP_0183333732 /NCGR_PEP_ID=MMETSP0164_2-20130417/2556_1 /TAXON_ID=221442 /ORGANISM="Coccolithus pelagicus ssp braarudi, Strain PLY182g" /LENGTH=165 /DNA_ID=CAMNT_0025502737 /DNA_START=53 /DNA_END=551 /DNA_ORIENTATION=+
MLRSVLRVRSCSSLGRASLCPLVVPSVPPAALPVWRMLSQPLSNGSSRPEDDEGRRLYVGNLPWNMSADDVAYEFETSGEIVNAHLPRDQEGRSRGFAFVTFSSADEANAAAMSGMGEASVGGRSKCASPHHVARLHHRVVGGSEAQYGGPFLKHSPYGHSIEHG